MARSKVQAVPAEMPASAVESVSDYPSEWEWETVADESPSRVIFDTVGDVFVGRYVGDQHIEHEEEGEDASFDLFLFRGRDEALYAVNKSYKLVEAMKNVNPDEWVRIEFVKEIPVKKGNPLKDFRVLVRR